MNNIQTPIKIISIISFIAILKLILDFSVDEIKTLYSKYSIMFAHSIIKKELENDKVTYEIRGQTITASEATDADLKKALFYERTRALSCEDALTEINDILGSHSPAQP